MNPGFDEFASGLVRVADAAVEALCHVDDDDAAVFDGVFEGGDDAQGHVACSEGFEDDSLDFGGGENGRDDVRGDAGPDFEDDDFGRVHVGDGFADTGWLVEEIVVVDDNARFGDGGQGTGVGAFEARVGARADFGDSRSSEKFVAKVDAHFGDAEMRCEHDGAQEVVGSVGICEEHASLGTGQDYGLLQIVHEHKGQGRRGIAQRVGSMANHKGVEMGLIRAYGLCELIPRG